MRRLLIPLVLVPAAFLAACSSSSTSTTTGSTIATVNGTAAGTAVFPAVGSATDLGVEPTIAAGTPPPPTTLKTRDLVVGTGQTATTSDTVVVQYVGADYATGKDFDASWTDTPGKPATFSLEQVVPGFAQGIAGMKVGGRREIVIPPALGYGASGSGPVGANETLVFVVDLHGIS